MEKEFQQISDLVHNDDRAGARRLALDLLAGYPQDPQVLYVVSQFTDDIPREHLISSMVQCCRRLLA